MTIYKSGPNEKGYLEFFTLNIHISLTIHLKCRCAPLFPYYHLLKKYKRVQIKIINLKNAFVSIIVYAKHFFKFYAYYFFFSFSIHQGIRKKSYFPGCHHFFQSCLERGTGRNFDPWYDVTCRFLFCDGNFWPILILWRPILAVTKFGTVNFIFLIQPRL